MSVANPTRNKRARVVNNAEDPTFNNVTIEGDTTIDGTLDVTGISTFSAGINLPPLNAAPATTEGTLYLDDGSNTLSTEIGLRLANTGSLFVDVPFYQSGVTTPIIGDGTNDFTLSTAQSAWTRVGNRIDVNGFAIWSSIGAASGAIVIEDSSPYNIDTSKTTFANGTMVFFGITPTASHTVTIRNASGANFNVIEFDGPGVITNVTDAQFAAAGSMLWYISYQTAVTPA